VFTSIASCLHNSTTQTDVAHGSPECASSRQLFLSSATAAKRKEGAVHHQGKQVPSGQVQLLRENFETLLNVIVLKGGFVKDNVPFNRLYDSWHFCLISQTKTINVKTGLE
jgi:hypothetical protein